MHSRTTRKRRQRRLRLRLRRERERREQEAQELPPRSEETEDHLTDAFDYAALELRRVEAESEALQHVNTHAPTTPEVIQDIAHRVARQALEMQQQSLVVDMELAQRAAQQQSPPPIGDLRDILREPMMTHEEATAQMLRNITNREVQRRVREMNQAEELHAGGRVFAESVIAGIKELKEKEDQEEPPTPPDIQEEPMKISEKDTPALYAVMEGKAPREDCDGCPFNNLEVDQNMVSCQIVGKDFKKGLELTPCDFEKWETKARTEARTLFGGDNRPRPSMDDHRIKEVASSIANNASKLTDKYLAENRVQHGNRPWRNGDSKADSACPVYPAELKSAIYHGYDDVAKRVLTEIAQNQGTEDPSKAVNLAEFMILMASLTGRITALETELKEVKEAQSTEVAGAYEPEI